MKIRFINLFPSAPIKMYKFGFMSKNDVDALKKGVGCHTTFLEKAYMGGRMSIANFLISVKIFQQLENLQLPKLRVLE